MGGYDDHGGIIGDWMPPSLSPRSYIASMLGNSGGSRPVSEPLKYDDISDGGFTFPEPNRQIVCENSEQKTSSRGGLVERMAARAGHNAPRLNTDIVKPTDTLQNQQVRSPYLTISPGLSPTSLLDSPVFLSNSLVQPSPTTGKFQFAQNGNGRNSLMLSDSSNMSTDNFFEDANNPSFAFKPFPDLGHDHVNLNPPFMSVQSFQSSEPLVHSEKQFPPQKKTFEALNSNLERSQEHHDDTDQKINGDIANVNGASSEDGYNWRKYGQKQVKGSEYPRSYYKCTHQNCVVKKKVERSHEGLITEIIYKGAHNHSKVAQNRRSGIGSSSVLSDMQDNAHWGQESNFEVMSLGVVMQGENGAPFESSDAVDGSSTFSNDEEDDDHATHGSVSIDYDGEGDESESKRRKVEAYAADVSGVTRAMREPRVVVQTTSEVDILDDGYRWRKYGQKVVKGNPNPRSYYKCTSTGCTVRKHVERASHDLKSVITTYEGKHNHDVPAARNGSHASNTMAEPSRIQNTMARFERPPYSFPNGQHLGPTPTHVYGYTMNHQGPGGLAHMAMANQGKMPVLPVPHYLGQPHHMNQMGPMVPKYEPKVEPMSDPGLNLANGAPIYHQMNRLPLGPQM